ncbi:MAG: 3-phosphoshikimate 1-carboxyvinyltransferase [Sedimentisphaerales bacterium]|nr:3-phosphoshikimate 1-carboxyvinyltransferase [Sedimentisphaerales bacterium]
MQLIAEKSSLSGTVAIPGSKSHTIRAVAMASLAKGESCIEAPLDSADTRSAVTCYRALGAQIGCDDTCWTIKGFAGQPTIPANVIDVGNSGTTLRFALGSAALLRAGGAAVFTGDAQIRNRPVGPLLNSLTDLGAKAWSTRRNDKAPAVVQGELVGGETTLAAVTSQYLSSLLFNTPLAPTDTRINVTLLNERPYVEITLRYLDEQGIIYRRSDDMSWFDIQGGQHYQAFTKRIPADFSSATFFFCAGAILDGEITLQGLDFTDAQGDKAVVDILRQMGADIQVINNNVIIKQGRLNGGEFDLNAVPDSLPALAATACFAEDSTRFYNVAQARLKETDRIAVMAGELKKFGAIIEEHPDGLTITPSKLHSAQVNGHDDHRIVMALSLAGMALEGKTAIDTAEAINVTFPGYVNLMASLGGKIRLIA